MEVEILQKIRAANTINNETKNASNLLLSGYILAEERTGKAHKILRIKTFYFSQLL